MGRATAAGGGAPRRAAGSKARTGAGHAVGGMRPGIVGGKPHGRKRFRLPAGAKACFRFV